MNFEEIKYYKFKISALIFLLTTSIFYSQNYTSYFTGNTTNIVTTSQGGICMMGGASENDEAMRWFLNRANGGDVLVLRASGSNGYNNYMYSELGITVNSVETIVFNDATAALENVIHQKIQNAEAIWFAGGNQWNYVDYWRNTQIQTLINEAIQNRNIVIGGTSAGMAILGNYYFSGQNGTVTSTTALVNPYDSRVTVDSAPFLGINILSDVITDTHYDDPNRKGRHVVFLARILTDFDVAGKGIACNEYTAVCIDENNIARVYGDYPNYEESAYFLQTNCELNTINPENCTANNPLNWNLDSQAIKVYKVNGTNNGMHTFDLNTWQSGNGGEWQNWYVANGTLFENTGNQLNCASVSVNDFTLENNLKIFPNPFIESITIQSEKEILKISIIDMNGNQLLNRNSIKNKTVSIDTSIESGIYYLKIVTKAGIFYKKVVKLVR